MEWLGLGLVGALVFFWWLGRDPSPQAPPGPVSSPGDTQRSRPAGSDARAAVTGTGAGLLGAEVVRRATDMNDPDGTFMDGYVAGRLTERAEARDEMDAWAARHADDDLSTAQRRPGDDDESWETGGHGADHALDQDMSDDW